MTQEFYSSSHNSRSRTNWHTMVTIVSDFFKCPMVLLTSINQDRYNVLCSIGFHSPELCKNRAISDIKLLPSGKGLLRIPDASKDHRFSSKDQKHLFQEKEKVAFYLSIPILYESRKMGFLYLMDHYARHDFDSDQQQFLAEFSHIVAGMMADEQPDYVAGSPTKHSHFTLLSRGTSHLSQQQLVHQRILSLLKIPLRNGILLQRAMAEFHNYLTHHNKKASHLNSPNTKQPGTENLAKTETYKRQINQFKRLVELSVEAGLLSIQSFLHYLEIQNHHKTGGPGHPRLVKQGTIKSSRYVSVKDWMDCIRTYTTICKDTTIGNSQSKQIDKLMTKMDWNYEESESLEIEEFQHYEVIGKIVELLLLPSYHKWSLISVNISISDLKDEQRQIPQVIMTSGGAAGGGVTPTSFPQTPFTDENKWRSSSPHPQHDLDGTPRSTLDMNEYGPTGRIHIDIHRCPKPSQITHLLDENHYYTLCDEFVTQLIRLLPGQLIVHQRGNGHTTEDMKCIIIPCRIRERKHPLKPTAEQHESLEQMIRKRAKSLFQRNSNHEEENDRLSPSKIKTKTVTVTRASVIENTTKVRDFTEADDHNDLERLHDLSELYEPTTGKSTKEDFSHDRDELENSQPSGNLQKQPSSLGVFEHQMAHVKRNKIGGTNSTSSKYSHKVNFQSYSGDAGGGSYLLAPGRSIKSSKKAANHGTKRLHTYSLERFSLASLRRLWTRSSCIFGHSSTENTDKGNTAGARGTHNCRTTEEECSKNNWRTSLATVLRPLFSANESKSATITRHSNGKKVQQYRKRKIVPVKKH